MDVWFHVLSEDANRKISSISAADSGFNDKSGDDVTEAPPVNGDQKVSLPNVPERPDPRPVSKTSTGSAQKRK